MIIKGLVNMQDFIKWLESNLVHFEKYEKSREILTLKKKLYTFIFQKVATK